MFNKIFAKTRQVNAQFADKKPSKIWLLLGILYIVLPFDFDFVPMIGWIDDLLVIFFLLSKYINNDTGDAIKRFMEGNKSEKISQSKADKQRKSGPIVEGEIIEEK